MAAENAFETSTQSTGPTILPDLARSLVTFRSTAYKSVSQSVTRPHNDGLVGRVPIGDRPHKNDSHRCKLKKTAFSVTVYHLENNFLLQQLWSLVYITLPSTDKEINLLKQMKMR